MEHATTTTVASSAAPVGQITTSQAALEYALAGDAVLTVVSLKTRTRFTYRIRALRDDDGQTSVWFVDALVGADNDNDYRFFGSIRPAGHRPPQFRCSAKSKIDASAPVAQAFAWTWNALTSYRGIGEQFLVYHAGACGRCGRTLTTPESVERGLGPVCAQIKNETSGTW